MNIDNISKTAQDRLTRVSDFVKGNALEASANGGTPDWIVINRSGFDLNYPIYGVDPRKSDPKSNQPREVLGQIVISGKAGVYHERQNQTPTAVNTEVTNEAMEILMKDSNFLRQLSEGYLTRIEVKDRAHATAIAQSHLRGDGGAQLTEKDVKALNNAIPKQGGVGDIVPGRVHDFSNSLRHQ